jgi:hypothetical protein
LEKVACFSTSKNVRLNTTINHATTTLLPSKNHVKNMRFCKTPCKNAFSPQQKKLNALAPEK